VPGEGGCIVLFLLRPLNAGRRLFPRKRHADGFGTFNFATLVFLLLARHSPQAVSARAACVGCHQKYRESRDDVAGVLYLFSAKSTDRSLRLVLFAAFWSAVNRGLRPRGTLYFLTAKSTKNSPADTFAYFVPSNVRNGRLFAGLQANRPRFLPLLAGPSFHGSGIGPGSFAAKGGAGVRRLFYGCLHRTGSQYPAVAPESGFKPLYAFCRAGFSSRDIGKLSTFHF